MKCFGSPSKAFRCKIILLDETELIQEIKAVHKGQDILDIVFKHLSLLETVYFGLRFINSKGFSCWLESNKNVIRQIKGIEPITFYFGVRFYACDPCKLVEEATRYQFFLQIKQDIQQCRLSITNELAAQLLAYIIQSELGDYDPRTHQFGYVSEFRLIVNQTDEFNHTVCELHKKLIGQIPAAVEMQFLERIKWLDLYGCELHSVIAEDTNEYFLGLGPHGITVLKNKFKVGNYFWPRIMKVCKKGKFFMIKVVDKNSEENTYGFEMPSKQASRQIYKSCKEHKDFFRLTQNNDSFKNLSKFGTNAQVAVTRDVANKDRPAPVLVRVPSRRYQRMGKPGGSEVPPESRKENFFFENGTNLISKGMSRHHSTPSLQKTHSLHSKYTSPYAQYEYSTNRTQRGMFSKSANASPLSVRSAFVSRYDYGRNNYVSPMKRNSSSSSLQKIKHSRISDNESEVSKCSRSSRQSSRKCKHNRNGDDSGTESDSSRKRRSRRKQYGTTVQPQLVDWNEILEQRCKPNFATKRSNAVVRNVTGLVHPQSYDTEIDSANELNRKDYRGYLVKSADTGKYYDHQVKKYIQHEPIDVTNLSEREKKDIRFTNFVSDPKFYKTWNPNATIAQYGETNLAHKGSGNFNGAPSYSTLASSQHRSYPKNRYDTSLSSMGICDNKGNDKMADNSYGSYLDYSQSHTLGHIYNSGQISLSQSAPRVTFQNTPSTAYFSNGDVYHNGKVTNGVKMGGGSSRKEISSRTHEMSTEL